MNEYIIILLFTFICSTVKAQSCDEIMEYVKSESYGTSYSSYTSDVISKVTFYTVTVDYNMLHFAIVCFKKKYSYSCNEYIYQVVYN